MTHIEKFKALAAALGGEFVPLQWHTDEQPLDDKGYIVFGDCTDWKSVRLFIHAPWKGKVYNTAYCSNRMYTVDGITKQLPGYPTRSEDAINIGQDRPIEAATKAIKHRLLDACVAAQPEKVAAVEAEMSKAEELVAWKTRMGLDPARERGRVWHRKINYAGPSAELRVGYDCDVTISSLSRAQVEWLVGMLEGMP